MLKACPCAAVIRTSWIYSPYGNNFVRTMLRLSETQPIVRVVDDQRGTPTSAADLAAAILRSSSGFGRPTAVTMPEFTIWPVKVKRVGMDLRPRSSRASPAAGDASRDCRPSRRQNIQLRRAVPEIHA